MTVEKPDDCFCVSLCFHTGLQNVLGAPWEEFIYGGKIGADFSEWNYPGINTNDIINPMVRELK